MKTVDSFGQVDSPEAGERQLPASKTARGRRRRKLRTWLVMLSPVLLLIWLAPTLVAHSPLRNRALQSAAAELHGTLSAGSASLGWWSPVVLRDVEVRDEEGNSVLKIAAVEGQRSLWQLLLNSRDLGHIRILGPQLTVELTGDSSNLEHLLQSYLYPNRPSTNSCPSMDLELLDGTITVRDTTSSRHWQIEKFEMSAALARDWSQPLQVKLAGTLPQPDRIARFSAEMQLPGPAASADFNKGRLKVESQELPLALVEPLLWRRIRDLRLDGWLTSNLEIAWQGQAGGGVVTSIAGEIAADQLLLAALSVNPDELRFASLQLPCRLELHPDRVVFRQLAIRCDAGELEIKGDLPVRLGQDPATAVWEALSREAYEIHGRVELARLAALLPRTLRIREGIRIDEGEVQLSLSRSKSLSENHRGLAHFAESSEQNVPVPFSADGSRIGSTQPGDSAWRGHVKTNRLAAVNRDKQLIWDKPIDIQFAAHEGAKGLEIDRLVCTSSFFELEGAGSLEALSINATYDLNRLANELGQFVDLGDIELAGDGWSYLSCHRYPDGKVEVDGECQIKQFRLTSPGRLPWSEENLVANLSVVGHAEKTQLQRIDAATFKLGNKDDQLQLRLLQPMDASTAKRRDARFYDPWPVELKLQGELATWRPRLAVLLGERPEWRLSGTVAADATLAASTRSVEVVNAHFQLAQLSVDGPAIHLTEPRIQGELTRLKFPAPGRLELNSFQANAAAGSLNLKNLIWLAANMPDGPSLTGHCQLTGDLARLQTWFGEPSQPPANQWSGQLQGTLDLALKGQQLGAEVALEVANLIASQNNVATWNEPQVKLNASAQYDRKSDGLTIDRLQFVSAKLGCEAAGRLDAISTRRELQLSGKLDYDPQHLLQMLRPYLGEGIEMVSARESRAFSLQGPLGNVSAAPAAALAAVKAETSLGWTGANVYGFRVGSGELKAKLADGLLDIAPLDLAVSEGRLTASPRFRLSPEPSEMVMGKGPLLTQVRISPEMCDRGLKFVAPVLAGVTQAEGKFSIAMDGCRVPLADLKKGEFAGQFTVHSVEIGPGPLVRELAVLLEKNATAKLSRESVVPFRMVEGRIYHRDLELVFPDLTIRTHGSVGLDQSLAIIAEMPVPPKWIGDNAIGSALKNQTIRLPIAGTLDQPKLDQQALQQATAAFLRNSAKNVLLDEVNKRLDKLFKP